MQSSYEESSGSAKGRTMPYLVYPSLPCSKYNGVDLQLFLESFASTESTSLSSVVFLSLAEPTLNTSQGSIGIMAQEARE